MAVFERSKNMNTKTETLNAIKDERLYDFLANEGWQMTKDEVLIIAKELAFALQDLEERACYSLPILDDVKEDLIKELEEKLSDEDE
jgi:hypothetical protein